MEPFRIEGLDVNQIGPFEHLKLDFPKKKDPEKAEIHIFTGENGTGKTTLLECMVNQVSSRKSWSSYGEFSIKYSDIIKPCKYTLDNVGSSLFASSIGSTVIEQYIEDTEKAYAIHSFAFFTYSGNRHFKDFNLAGIKEIEALPLLNSTSFSYSSDSSLFIQWVANTLTREALEFKRGNAEDVESIREKIQLLEDSISEFIGNNVKFNLLSSFPLKVTIDIEKYGKNLDLEVLPDGIKSIMGWLGDLMMRLDRVPWQNNVRILDRNIILFLDEIEVHLHPAWQRKVLPVVQKLFKNAQIFVSTHSPFVVGSVDGAWVYRFDKKGNYATLAEGFPILSEDAKSYDYILEEVFGIKERFGIEVEKKLTEFKALKTKLLKNEPIDEPYFRSLVHELANQSVELESIIGMELRQIKRITNKDFWELSAA